MRARRLDRRAHFLTDGIEIDERTFRCAKGLALLHRFDTFRMCVHIYRTSTFLDVMVFAKTRESSLAMPLARLRSVCNRCDISSATGLTCGYTLVTMTPTPKTRQYRYYDFVMAAYVCILLCSNLIGPA